MLKEMFCRPISPNRVQEKTQLSPPAVNVCLREIDRMDIAKEATGKTINHFYSYVESIQIMNKDAQIPPCLLGGLKV